MNIINTIFDKGPRWICSLIVAAAGYTYARKRFNALFWSTIKELQLRDFWTEDQIAKWQEERIRSLLIHAYRKSDFYRDRFETEGITEEKIKSSISAIDILKTLPTLSRRDVATNADKMLVKNYESLTNWHRTSGTTGQQLQFALPARLRWPINYSHVYRFYGWHGFNVKDARVTIGGRYLGRKRKGVIYHNPFENQLLLGVHGLGPHSIVNYVRELNRFCPVAIQGHPSAIIRLISLAEEFGMNLPILSVVFVTGETVSGENCEKIETTFNAPLVSLYGHGEMCVMAAQCEYQQGFHVDPFYGYVELINHPSGYKEIVATSLQNDVMPFIRYRTGDLVDGWIYSPCACGRSFPRLNQIFGRIDDIITDTSGQPVMAVQIRTDLSHAFSKMPPYSIVQYVNSKLYALRLYSDKSDAVNLGVKVTERLRHWLGKNAEIVIEVRPASEIHLTSGKHKTVIRDPLL